MSHDQIVRSLIMYAELGLIVIVNIVMITLLNCD